jgi:hypothetical protein
MAAWIEKAVNRDFFLLNPILLVKPDGFYTGPTEPNPCVLPISGKLKGCIVLLNRWVFFLIHDSEVTRSL